HVPPVEPVIPPAAPALDQADRLVETDRRYGDAAPFGDLAHREFPFDGARPMLARAGLARRFPPVNGRPLAVRSRLKRARAVRSCINRAAIVPAYLGRPGLVPWVHGPCPLPTCAPALRRSGVPAIRRSGVPAIRRSGTPAVGS